MTLRRALALSVLLASDVGADYAAYDGVRDLTASNGNTRAEHHHDWRRHVAYVRVLDATTGRKLLERPSPALSTLWVSPDGRYVVGLSAIKSRNPHQLFVLSRDGAYEHAEGVLCGDPRLRGFGCSESVTNVVEWYDQERPEIELRLEADRPAELAVNAHHPRYCKGPKGEGWSDEDWREVCPETGDRLRLPLAK